MTPLQRKKALHKLYWRLQADMALCQQLDLPSINSELRRHAEKIGALAEAVQVRKMSRNIKRVAEGKSEP